MPENEPLSQGCGLGGAWELEEEEVLAGQVSERPATRAGERGGGPSQAVTAGQPAPCVSWRSGTPGRPGM